MKTDQYLTLSPRLRCAKKGILISYLSLSVVLLSMCMSCFFFNVSPPQPLDLHVATSNFVP